MESRRSHAVSFPLFLALLGRRLLRTRPLILPLLIPAHQFSVSGALTSFPEATASSPPDHAPTTDATVLTTKALFAGTPTADHPISVLVDMFFCPVMAPIARMDAITAGEAEPAV